MKVIKLNFEVLFSKRLLVRAASSIVMAIPAVTFVFLGGLYFIAFLAFLAGVMSWELSDTIHKSKKYLASTMEILALYVDLDKRKTSEFEEEKIKIMDNYISENKSKFNTNNLVFSGKLKK